MARLTFLLLLLWVGVTVSTVVDLQKRIFNGRNCDTKKERLYHVALSDTDPVDDVLCGGSLIKPQWILTAAHCCDLMYAVVGVHPGPGTTVKIQEKHIYRNHDIMLMKLPSPVTNINPIPLPDNNECNTKLGIGEDVQVAGHGQIDKNGNSIISPPKDLQCVTMQVSMRADKPADKWICYKGNDKGTCPGDSGGGVEYKDKLRAVHVKGLMVGCTKHCSSLNVCNYKQWIEEKTK